MIGLVVMAATLGDAVGYLTGRRTGRPLLVRRNGRVLNPRTLLRAELFYQRFGAQAVVAARFIPWVRTFTPILAGVAEMPYRRFLLALVGALCWGGGLLSVGYLAAEMAVWPAIMLAGGALAVLLGALGGLASWSRGRARADR